MISRFRTGPESKPAWRSVPPGVREAVEQVLGQRVVSARRVWGGYAPSATFKLDLADGGAAFFKGAGSADSLNIRAIIQRESRVYRELPGIQPWAPRFLCDFETEGWSVLLLEFVRDARGAGPWTAEQVRAVLEASAALHDALAEQSLPEWVAPIAARLLEQPNSPAGWRSLSCDAQAVSRLAGLAGPTSGEAAAWLTAYAPRLADLEAGIAAPKGKTTLVHWDIRSDNILFRDKSTVVFVDWPLVSSGPGIIDAVEFLVTVAAEGGPPPDRMLPHYIEGLNSPVANDDLVSAVAAVSGYFAARAALPDLPELPRLRPWQRAQLVASLDWLTRLVKLDRPAWLSHVQPQVMPLP